MAGWNLQLIALNSPDHPLISRGTAESLVLLIVEERYPEDIFRPGAVATADLGDHWRVEVDNVLTPTVEERGFLTSDRRLLPNKLVFTIRKFNGEITSVL